MNKFTVYAVDKDGNKVGEARGFNNYEYAVLAGWYMNAMRWVIVDEEVSMTETIFVKKGAKKPV